MASPFPILALPCRPIAGSSGSSAATRLSISRLTHRCPAVPGDLSEWRGHSVGWFSEEIPDLKGTVFSQGSNLEPCDSEIWRQPLSHSFQVVTVVGVVSLWLHNCACAAGCAISVEESVDQPTVSLKPDLFPSIRRLNLCVLIQYCLYPLR